MADTAASLVDGMLPEVPVRQWVLTLSFPLRYRCARNAQLMSEVLRCFLRALFADQQKRAKREMGVSGGLCGGVTFIQRFGSALNLTPHLHTLVLDGAYGGTANEAPESVSHRLRLRFRHRQQLGFIQEAREQVGHVGTGMPGITRTFRNLHAGTEREIGGRPKVEVPDLEVR
jgi:hypothetical protein